jgi:hypothetical protein
MTDTTEYHPVQIYDLQRHPNLPALVTRRAYEVYCALHGEQEAMVTGGCRGGFGAGELIAYLYAHSFPKDEWRKRFEEALRHKQH